MNDLPNPHDRGLIELDAAAPGTGEIVADRLAESARLSVTYRLPLVLEGAHLSAVARALGLAARGEDAQLAADAKAALTYIGAKVRVELY